MKKETVKFYTAKEVTEILGVSVTTAYRIIKKLNNELSEKGYITIPGKISKRYFEEKVYM
ncbi:helix-turn-helix transcriptional regulator [Vallitalea sp.]|jgi:transposase|uniref:helix-turn-helix transcriptional regulator n=1 Tax=Vallitalea sp. TaxID=1882829 RepID=UPI0025EDC611|nr:helix-turn-helix domain-containing protein [Vallitalea sp.]MCT4686604.1 helix-turn-helix domain-containing protein [Vallitalea sp.]